MCQPYTNWVMESIHENQSIPPSIPYTDLVLSAFPNQPLLLNFFQRCGVNTQKMKKNFSLYQEFLNKTLNMEFSSSFLRPILGAKNLDFIHYVLLLRTPDENTSWFIFIGRRQLLHRLFPIDLAEWWMHRVPQLVLSWADFINAYNHPSWDAARSIWKINNGFPNYTIQKSALSQKNPFRMSRFRAFVKRG